MATTIDAADTWKRRQAMGACKRSYGRSRPDIGEEGSLLGSRRDLWTPAMTDVVVLRWTSKLAAVLTRSPEEFALSCDEWKKAISDSLRLKTYDGFHKGQRVRDEEMNGGSLRSAVIPLL